MLKLDRSPASNSSKGFACLARFVIWMMLIWCRLLQAGWQHLSASVSSRVMFKSKRRRLRLQNHVSMTSDEQVEECRDSDSVMHMTVLSSLPKSPAKANCSFLDLVSSGARQVHCPGVNISKSLFRYFCYVFNHKSYDEYNKHLRCSPICSITPIFHFGCTTTVQRFIRDRYTSQTDHARCSPTHVGCGICYSPVLAPPFTIFRPEPKTGIYISKVQFCTRRRPNLTITGYELYGMGCDIITKRYSPFLSST